MSTVKINNHDYTVKSDLRQITFKEYEKVSKLFSDYNKWLTEFNKEVLKKSQKKVGSPAYVKQFERESELQIQGYKIVMDVCETITDIPREMIEKIPIDHLMKIFTAINIKKLELTEKPRSITLTGETPDAISILRANMKALGIRKIKERNKIRRKLNRITRVSYDIHYEVREECFEVFVVTQEIRKKMLKAKKELDAGNLRSLLTIIAYIVRPKDGGIEREDIEKRVKIFEDMPMQYIFDVTGFFLKTLTSS